MQHGMAVHPAVSLDAQPPVYRVEIVVLVVRVTRLTYPLVLEHRRENEHVRIRFSPVPGFRLALVGAVMSNPIVPIHQSPLQDSFLNHQIQDVVGELQ